MNLTLADLVPLLPLLIVTGAPVIAMLVTGIYRIYALIAGITITGLLAAAIASAVLMPVTNVQVTPLLIVDQYSLFFSLLVCAAAMFIGIFSFRYLTDLDDYPEEYYLLLGIATIGAVVMVSSNHFASTVLGVEILSMSLYGMVAYPVHSKAAATHPLEASVKYLVLSAVASTFLLFGMALIYAQSGTLSFVDLADAPGTPGAAFTILGLLMIVAGAAFKLSMAPFHIWTPDVYEGAPLPVTAYLATVGKAAMFVVVLRFVEISGALNHGAIVVVLGLLAAASILVGNLLALLQDNLKRILAYSSIAHMGYLLIGLIAGFHVLGTISVEAVSFYLLAYVVMSLGAFGVAAILSTHAREFDSVADYQGLFWRSPWLAAVFTGMLLSLAGIPLTVGFIGKFYLFLAGVEAELWLLLALLIIGSGIGLYYYLRIVYCMLTPLEEGAAPPLRGLDSPGSHGVLALLLLLVLLLGVYPAPVMVLFQALSALI